ncbi:S-layer homology domain-containing protein [Candidatus Margulisiibacteriota bacterium]
MRKIILCFLLALLLLQGSVAAQSYMAWDPTRHIPNGRVLGLGKAYMGLADDTGAIYSNPAGLAGINGWQLSSMSGRFLEEFSYLSASGVYPTRFGTFGLGFAGSFIGGAHVTKIADGSDPDDPIYEIDTSVAAVSNSNTVTIFSWGNRADKFLAGTTLSDRLAFFQHPVFENISLGASFKYFFASLTGDHISSGQGDASGMEVDLGIQYQTPLKWLKLGLTAQNVLPFAMGGKLHYATGHDESYPAILEGGAAIRVLGQKDSLLRFRDQEVLLLVDMDYYPTLSNYPTIMHFGLEWKPIRLMAVRMGIDQDVAGDGAGGLETLSNLTGGVGLTVGGFRFDYAYHQYVAAPGVTNNYFSLAYGLEPPAPITDGLVSKPDKVVTFDNKIMVEGQAILTSIVKVQVNGLTAKLDPNGNFSASAPLELGKNAIKVEAFSKDGKLIESDKLRVLRLITYPDVPSSYWTYEPVGYIGTMGIIKGYPDGNFKPEGSITRAEMATLLVRTLAGGDDKVSAARFAAFPDVPLKHWACKYVNLSFAEGIVKGYPDGTFRPKNNITRAEGVTMVSRFSSVTEEAFTDEFVDVPASHWAAKTIAGAHKAGMLEYLRGKPFELKRLLTRAESVEILFRSPRVKRMIDADLKNWDSY